MGLSALIAAVGALVGFAFGVAAALTLRRRAGSGGAETDTLHVRIDNEERTLRARVLPALLRWAGECKIKIDSVAPNETLAEQLGRLTEALEREEEDSALALGDTMRMAHQRPDAGKKG